MREKQTPSTNRIRETLGRLYENQPPHFREYMRRYQQDPTSRVFAPLAEAYRRLGRIDEAIDVCLEGLKHHPDFIGGRVALARCFLDKKKYSRAKDELEIVVGISPDNLLAQRLLGDCFFSLQEMEQALRCYKIASVLSPDDVGLQDKVHRMEMQMSRGDFDSEGPAELVEPLAKALAPETKTENIGGTLAIEAKSSGDALISDFGGSESGDDLIVSQGPAETMAQIESFHQTGALLPEMEQMIESDLQAQETEEDELRRAKVEAILGLLDDKDDSFKTENVSRVFTDETPNNAEITTQTLGDLYFSQGQFEKSLKIFEKIYRQRSTPELAQKIQSCRAQLGVDSDSLKRQHKIDALTAILRKNRNNR